MPRRMSRPTFRPSLRVCTAILTGALLFASATVQSQDKPKISEPTLKASSPPLPPPAAVNPAAPHPSPAASTNGNQSAQAKEGEEKAEMLKDIRFEGTPLADVLKFYSDMTKRTVIQPATLPQPAITLITQTQLTKAEAILAIESVLFANGIALTPMGDKFVKAVPNPLIAKEGVALSGPNAELPEGDRITAQVIPLRYLDVSDTSMIQSLVQFTHQGQGGTLVPLARSNSLLIIDTTLTVRRLQEILERLDQPVENRVQTKFYTLKNAEASKVAATLQSLISGAQPTPGAVGRPIVPPRGPNVTTGLSEESIVVGKVTIQSDDRTNMLIILSRPSNYEFLDEIIEALDAKAEPEIRFKAFKLEHAKADDVADLILQLTGSGSQASIQRKTPTTQTTKNPRVGQRTYGSGNSQLSVANTQPIPQLPILASRPTPGGTAGQNTNPALSTPDYVLSARARVIPDSRQGSVLVLGTASDVDLVERIIPEVDLTLAQVMIESVIVEVTLDNSTEFGVNLLQRQWNQNGVQGAGASLPGITTSNALQKLAFLSDPSKLAAASAAGSMTYFLSFNGLDLDAIIHATAGLSNFKVLQKPLLVSSQNEPAHIFVGESRPIVTSTQTGLTSDTTVNSQVEQLDIGVSLDITPNITPAGLVELQVEQIVENVSGQVLISGNLQPVVARRELGSLVSVQDKGVVALGGLIQNSKNKTETKVPILGDIPLLGYLFKSTTWQDNRIELIVFLRPTVLHNASDAQKEAQKLRDKFKGLTNIPKEDVPPLEKEPSTPTNKPWYAPFQPPTDPK